ncbi:MAG: DUF4234 domain-containing protein [Asgard group archaeon]|nr:DUF4234 domain-containing protein [Asgard group archaeon]
MVKERDPMMTIVFMIISCGLYMLYWLYETSKELTELGAELPTIWFIFIPGVNIYYIYKYTEEWHRIVKYKEQEAMIVFLLCFVYYGYFIIQTELNKLVK